MFSQELIYLCWITWVYLHKLIYINRPTWVDLQGQNDFIDKNENIYLFNVQYLKLVFIYVPTDIYNVWDELLVM